MKIGFIAEPYEEQNASGMGYVVLELVENLLKYGNEHEFVIYSSKPFKKERLADNAKNIIIPPSFWGKFFWFLKNCEELDVLLYVMNLLPVIAPKKIKTILICQELAGDDIKPRSLKEWIKFFLRDKILAPIVFKRAYVVVAASNATEEEILRTYKIEKDKVKVVYDGFQNLRIYESEKEGENLKPYFFFAGRVKYRKNVRGIVEGFIKFKNKIKSDCKLVVVGGYGGEYYENIISRLKENGLDKDAVFAGYATGGKLASFYKNALCCVFPSFHEGFGMPIVEAMSLGVPVITSNISSMVEVAGEAGILVNPYNIDEIAAAMEKIFLDENLRKEKIQQGLERANIFSWEKAAVEYLNLIKSV